MEDEEHSEWLNKPLPVNWLALKPEKPVVTLLKPVTSLPNPTTPRKPQLSHRKWNSEKLDILLERRFWKLIVHAKI